jgi:hypothetical protein
MGCGVTYPKATARNCKRVEADGPEPEKQADGISTGALGASRGEAGHDEIWPLHAQCAGRFSRRSVVLRQLEFRVHLVVAVGEIRDAVCPRDVA